MASRPPAPWPPTPLGAGVWLIPNLAQVFLRATGSRTPVRHPLHEQPGIVRRILCYRLFGLLEGMPMIRVMIAIAALAAMNTAAHSQTTVDQWIALCSKGTPASCESYARGVADAVLAMQAVRPQLSTACIPAGVTGKDLVTLAFPYAQGQPAAARQL